MKSGPPMRAKVVEAFRDGLDPHEIARAYGLAEVTVEDYLRGVRKKERRLWCVTGGHWWTKSGTGKIPWSCPQHPAGRTP